MWGTGFETRRDTTRTWEGEREGGQRGVHGVTVGTEGLGDARERRGWRRASIHIHPGVATGTLITCFNLPTADWASICHSKSVIARGATPTAPVPPSGYSLCLLCVLPLLPYWSFSTFVQPRTAPIAQNRALVITTLLAGPQSAPGFKSSRPARFCKASLGRATPA